MKDDHSAASGAAIVLLVDDQPADLHALEALLEPLGHHLLPAYSSQEALQSLAREDVALIIIDLHHAPRDGFDIAEAIRSRGHSPRIPILFLTSERQDEERIFRDAGADLVDALLKPVHPAALRSKVQLLVGCSAVGERLKAQEKEELEHRLLSLIEAMPLSVSAADARGHVYYGNRVWHETVGTQETQGVDLFEGVSPEDRERVYDAWIRALSTAKPLEIQYRQQHHARKTTRWMLVRVVPGRDSRGRLSGWISVATDIDKQKHLEEHLHRVTEHEQRARREAEAVSRSKDEFLAILSHELRTPLTVIRGWLSILRKVKLTPEQQGHALDVIARNVETQRKLIEDVLEMSRIVTGRLRLELKPVELRGIVDTAVNAARPAADAKQIKLVERIGYIGPMFRADPIRLQQIIWNLVWNAVKFSPPGARVEVTAQQDEDHVRLQVIDNGAGIEADALPHLFDRFWQAESPSTRVRGGLGLGLAIVRHLVELHGGTVYAESEGLGRGATFTVELPLGRGAERMKEQEERTAPTMDRSIGAESGA
jgi:PAS domain S-box-containing protein